MKITFVSAKLDLSGGSRIVAKYADELSLRGHQVTVIEYRQVPPWHRRMLGQAKAALSGKRVTVEPHHEAHFDGARYEVQRLTGVAPLPAHLVPDADAIIATWWVTAEWVAALPPSKGKGVYFIQHHEVFDYLPVERARATYRSRLRKIVISRWLADILERTYQQRDVVLIPNAVDHEVFKASSRQRNAVPVIGFMYSSTPFKGTPHIVEVLRQLHETHPEIRCISFGASDPALDGYPLPDFIEFSLRPAQDRIPMLYAEADAWIIGSEAEGFCMPALEAMACGTPVISTRTGWPMEGIARGINGFLYDYADCSGLRNALDQLLSLSKDDWRAMSEQAQFSSRQLNWRDSVDLFEATLHLAD
jgi:glycosyltransferase involved in cell wall biosynthesis